MLTRRALLAGILMAGLAVGACSSAATPVPTAVPSPTASAGPTKTTDGTLPKPELSTLKIGATLGEVGQFPTKLAETIGIYQKYGISTQVTIFNSEGNATSAIHAGQTQVTAVGSSAALQSRLTDSKMKMITIGKVKVIDGLFCGKDIKTAADLKGKSIAISALGGTPHATALMALEALKVSPKDVLFQTVGSESVRVAALKSGAVSCAPVGMALAPDLTVLGLNLLVDLSKTDLQFASTGLAVPDTFAAQYPNTTLILAASLLEAQNYMWTNPAETAAKWAEYAQIDVARARTLVDAVPAQQNRSLRWKDDAFVFMQKVVAIVTPGIMTIDPRESFDRNYLETLEDIGFYKKLGVPLE